MAKAYVYTVAVLFVVAAVLGSAQGSKSSRIKNPDTKGEKIAVYFSEFVGFKETPLGSNRGWLPDAGNKLTSVPKGSFWCASSMYYGFHTTEECVTVPRSAYVPSWVNKSSPLIVVHDRRWKTPAGYKPYVKTGCLFTIYFPKQKRDAHIGMIENPNADSTTITTLEGNASNGLSRNGDGFYRNTRRTATLSKCACPPELLTLEEIRKFVINNPYKRR